MTPMEYRFLGAPSSNMVEHKKILIILAIYHVHET